jgi:F-type H+-transporting ATPase subunit delta
MAKFDDKEMAIARVYAQAILELTPADARDSLLEELDGLVAVVRAQPEFAGFLASPMVDQEARRSVIEKALQGVISDLLLDSLQIMNRKSRLPLLPAVAEAYRQEYDRARGVVAVRVRTAVGLDDAQRNELTARLKEVTKKTPAIEEIVDPSIVGGMIVQIGDLLLDGSVARQLEVAGRKIQERASKEIRSNKSYWA